MQATKVKYETVDQYIREFPKPVQAMLQELRSTIKAAAPKAEECISYNIPAYKQNGPVVYFAAFKSHIGFYPLPASIRAEAEKMGYRTSKGTVQFPLDKKLPLAFVKKMVKVRMKENEEKAKGKVK